MTTLGLAEALQGARDTKNVTLKVEALQKIPQDTKQILFGVFQLAYSDKIRWVLPESDPPFKPLEESSDAQGRLIMELKNMSYFIARVENNKIKPVQENIPMLKRENLFIQILSSIGTYSFNLICISLFTCPAVFILRQSKKEIFVCSLFIFIAISFLIFGNIKNNQFNLIKNNSHDYKVRIVSPNVKLNRFYSNKDEREIINELIYLSNPVAEEKTIFVWPEGIISDVYSNNFKIYEDLFSKNFSENHLIIIGINSFENKNNKNLYFNSLAIFDNHLNLIDLYKKVKLVPFGEFLPFENFLSLVGLKTITNNYQSYNKGKEIRSINLKSDKFNISFLPLICYELIYSGNLYKDNKFDYIINISEDGWFGNSIGPKQHFAHGIFRSIESGKYIIRSANNGISAIINPSGKIDKKVEFGNIGYIDFVESKTVKTTLFSKYGNKIFILLILLYIFLIFSFNRIKNE